MVEHQSSKLSLCHALWIHSIGCVIIRVRATIPLGSIGKVQLQKEPIQMILTPTLMNVPRQHQVPAGVREDEEDNHEEEENSKKDR